ncbi:MAG: translation elongation factor Ts [Myxococcota bacterium]
MAEITAGMVKELREKTGAGMMDCKKALGETGGDLDAAVTYLREKGLAAAAKKAGRVAAEGLVRIAIEGKVAAIVEVNCETDFVAKNDDFQKLALDVSATVVKAAPADLDGLLDADLGGKKVKDVVTEKISTIGENISVRRFARLDQGDVYGDYLHGGGSIGVVVELKLEDGSKSGAESLVNLAKDLAMHVASEDPISVARDEVPESTLVAERAIYRQQALEQGKPENIVDKIVEGRVQKFFAERVLLEQPFVKDPDFTVKKLVEKVAKEVGTGVTLTRFSRFKVGEGIEKKSDNLAEEVARMTGGASA